MSQSLTTFGSDRRLVLTNGEAIRPPVYLTDWNVIRIGLQCCLSDPGANITGTPILAFGLCSGTDGYGATTSPNVLGLRNNNSTWTRTAGPPAYFYFGGGRGLLPFKKVGTTFTNGSAYGTGNSYLSCSTSYTNGYFLQITKGSPNYTLELVCPISSPTVQTNLTDTAFNNAMEAADMASAATACGYTSAVSQTLAFSEAAGALDHIFVYWDRTSCGFGFNIRHRRVS